MEKYRSIITLIAPSVTVLVALVAIVAWATRLQSTVEKLQDTVSQQGKQLQALLSAPPQNPTTVDQSAKKLNLTQFPNPGLLYPRLAPLLRSGRHRPWLAPTPTREAALATFNRS